jgi:hypothetical protein
MKKTLLLALALIAVGCTESGEIDLSLLETRFSSTPARNIDELKRLGLKWVDPVTLEPYSGTVFRLSDKDSQRILGKYDLKDGDFHGLYELYDENGQLINKGTYNMSVQCGEWLEEGETVTYDLCPPDLEGGN